jgi:hypothetical protein
MAGMTPIPIQAARTAAAMAALVLLAACGGSPSSTHPGGPANTGGPANAGGAAHSRSAVAFSHCMRSHGLPDYPDPDSSGTLPKTSAQLLGVSGSVFDAAQRACQQLLPATGGSLTASSIQQCYLAFVCPQALVQRPQPPQITAAGDECTRLDPAGSLLAYG